MHSQALADRITRMERENLMLKRVVLVALVLMVAALLMGQTTLPEEIVARKFTVVDDEGNPRVVLTGSGDVYGLVVLDDNEKPRSALLMTRDVPELVMFGPEEHKLVTMQGTPRRVFLALRRAEQPRIDVMLSADDNYSMLATCNSDGKTSSALGTHSGAGFIELYDTNGDIVLTQP
ncbi:MAG: hypothetical protein J7M38_04560 [Armatimonadetes bacterium]|nr:hypothetical protein [Armatimonadota bacterium]